MDGILTSVGTLTGEIACEATLSGELTAEGSLEGELTRAAQTLTPIYSGDYSFTPTEEAQTIAIDGKRATSNITVGAIPSEYVIPTGSQTVTENDTYDVKALAEMVVDVPTAEVQSKSVTPTESEQTVTPDDGYVGMDSVTVGAISSTYVGSGITRNDSDDLSASGNTVTAPAGYYAESASKSVASGSATTPATTITANPSISVNSSTGVITANVSKTQSVTPTVSEGYVSSGTSGTITVSGSNTSSLSTVNGSTISPTESEQTAVAANKYTLGAVKVGAISSSYVGTGITRRDSTALSASGATVTAPAGYYAESASKSVASGTAGTPTATKGTVSSHSISVTPSVTNVTGYITGGTKTGTAVSVTASELVSGTKSITSNGTNIDVKNYAAVDVAVPSGTPTLQTKNKSYTPTESAQSEAVTADNGYDGLDTVNVSVSAISSTYVGSGITRRDSTNMSASGRTITAPSGYYASNGTYQMAESQAVLTSSVDSTGLITSTLTTTSAGYRAAGTQTHTQQLTTQAAQTLHPSTTDQTIAKEKFLTGAQTFKAVTTSNLTADNIKNGVTVKIGDSTDDDCVTSVTGTYTGGGGGSSKNAQTVQSTTRTTSTSYTKLCGDITVATTGTYDVYWTSFRSSTSGTWGTQLYIGSTAYGTAQSTFSNHCQTVHLSSVSLTANQKVSVYGRSRGSNYYAYVGQLTIIEA